MQHTQGGQLVIDNIRVLVIDDEVKLCELIKQGLKALSSNFSIQTANSGIEAIELLSEQKYDVLITDIKMPKLDGIDLVNMVYEMNDKTVLIVITGHVNYEKELEARLKPGVEVSFLKKPISFINLLRSVESGIEKMAENYTVIA